MRLQEDMWIDFGSLSMEEAISLIEPFSESKIKNALEEIKSNSATGPDGSTAFFYKSFWNK
jgi:hypothetical protein